MILQVLAVAVPLAVAGLQAWRWPTLERRVKGHVELLKDLPDGVGTEFRAAVEDELNELAQDARHRLKTRLDWSLLALRLIPSFLVAGFGVSSVLAHWPYPSLSWREAGVLVLFIVFLFVATLIFTLLIREFWKTTVNSSRLDRTRRGVARLTNVPVAGPTRRSGKFSGRRNRAT